MAGALLACPNMWMTAALGQLWWDLGQLLGDAIWKSSSPMRALYFILFPVIFLFLFALSLAEEGQAGGTRPWGADVGAAGPPSCPLWPGGLWFSCWDSHNHVQFKLCSLKGRRKKEHFSSLLRPFKTIIKTKILKIFATKTWKKTSPFSVQFWYLIIRSLNKSYISRAQDSF